MDKHRQDSLTFNSSVCLFLYHLDVDHSRQVWRGQTERCSHDTQYTGYTCTDRYAHNTQATSLSVLYLGPKRGGGTRAEHYSVQNQHALNQLCGLISNILRQK